MTPTWQSDDGRVVLYCADCREVMAAMAPNSIDSIVTDPPYGLGFMGKSWDRGLPGVEFWTAALRIAKPGTHLLAFGGTRTYHRLTCAIEDAGWEIRDCIMWVYGSGFPKSHNGPWGGTALKPAWEPIIVARKPLAGTVAANVQEYGTGALNIDGCRIDGEPWMRATTHRQDNRGGRFHADAGTQIMPIAPQAMPTSGRWPANVVHDGSPEVIERFPHDAGGCSPASGPTLRGESDSVARGKFKGSAGEPVFHSDRGSAARFFYCAKASREDRNEGCEGLGDVRGGPEQYDSRWKDGAGSLRLPVRANHHPTVKPTSLIRWLVRLVTPPGGMVFDMFAGSGSTGKAALREGARFAGAETEKEYVTIAKARIQRELAQPMLIQPEQARPTQPELMEAAK